MVNKYPRGFFLFNLNPQNAKNFTFYNMDQDVHRGEGYLCFLEFVEIVPDDGFVLLSHFFCFLFQEFAGY